MASTAIRILILAAAAIATASMTQAQTYPVKPIKLVVPFPAGGATDTTARLVAQRLQLGLGQSVIIENQGGAGGTIAAKQVAVAAPDGYTLMMGSLSTFGTNPVLYKLDYDPMKAFTPVASAVVDKLVMVAGPALPVKTVQELVAYAKANPGKVNFSSGGIGVLPHLIGEWFKSAAAIDIVHVPYRGGGPSINDLVAGQVQMTFEGTSVLLPLIQSGKLRALATTSSKRIAELPDLPTMAESGFAGFVSTSWTGLLAPAHTPRDVIDKLNVQINEGLKSAELRSALGKLSNQPLGGTPQDFTDMIKGDIGKWAPIVKALGLTAG